MNTAQPMTLAGLYLELGALLAAGMSGTVPVFVYTPGLNFSYSVDCVYMSFSDNARKLVLEFGRGPEEDEKLTMHDEAPTGGALVRDMSLRDLFAASALQGALATRRATEDIGPLCYDIADAMLRAREAK